MAASVRSRSVVLAAAVLGHVGLIILLSSGTDQSRRPTVGQEQEAEPLLLILLEDLMKPEPTPVARDEPREMAPPSVDTAPLPQAILEPDLFDSAPPPPVSESVPPIDWAAEAGRSARAAIDRKLADDERLAGARERIGGQSFVASACSASESQV
ncbi:MAG: hypothetical protein WDO56_05795 [Gammaproteobacteria bacterium]